MAVDLLDDKDFEHHDKIVGPTADLAGCREPRIFSKVFQLMSLLMREKMSSGRFWYMRYSPMVSWPLFFLNIS